jgi:hypothetical protein
MSNSPYTLTVTQFIDGYAIPAVSSTVTINTKISDYTCNQAGFKGLNDAFVQLLDASASPH